MTIVGTESITLTKEQERMNLFRFGTKPFGVLTARNILQAVEMDLRKREENARRRQDNANTPPRLRAKTLSYAFPAKFVSSADDAASLLKAVIKERPIPKTVTQHMLYGDDALLAEALELAQS